MSAHEADEFIYVVSHDVRASARALKEIPTWIVEDLDDARVALPDEVADNLRLLTEHAERLDRMLVDLLTYSRISKEPPAAPLLFSEMVTELCAAIHVTPPRQLDWDIEPNLTVMIPAENARLLVQSMIDNAIKHGGDAFHVSLTRIGSFLQFSVTDTGAGIDTKDYDTVLKPLKTLQCKTASSGTGMGLACSKRIVDLAGGQLWFETTEQGFSSTACLPAASMPEES